jgi:endonuclease-3 related protein
MSVSDSVKVERILQTFAKRKHLPGWWPGNPQEVVIGAVLTQQTRWENVEQALGRLKDQGLCDISTLHRTSNADIEEAIRPSGFCRMKTWRIRNLVSFIVEHYGSVEHMACYPLPELRKALLEVKGIGAETADSILCFGLSKPTLVIDRYTERICGCSGIRKKGDSLKQLLEGALPCEISLYQEVHAQFVEHAKQYCRQKRCQECGIRMQNG